MKKLTLISATVALGCLAFAGAVQAQDLKIGVVTTLTGERALTGQYGKNGALLAIDQINAKGVNGKKLQIMFEDDGGSDAGAVNAFNKLVNLGADVVIAPIYSTMDLALSPSIRRAGMPTLVLGSSNDIAKQQNPWMFQNRTADAISATALANFAIKMGLKKIAILHDTDNFASGASAVATKRLQEAGLPPVLVETYNTGDKDFTPQLAKIKASGADGILAWSQLVEAGLIMKQLRSLDIKLPLIGSNSYVTKVALDLAKENAEGVYSVADYVPTNPAPTTQAFAAAYKAKYKIDSEFNAAMTHDAVTVIADAFKRAGSTDKAKMQTALAETKDVAGAATTFTYDANHVGGTSMSVVQVKGGVPTIMETIKGR